MGFGEQGDNIIYFRGIIKGINAKFCGNRDNTGEQALQGTHKKILFHLGSKITSLRRTGTQSAYTLI